MSNSSITGSRDHIEIVKEGKLLKRGEYIKNWRNRYMVLYADGNMIGFRDKDSFDEEPLNKFNLQFVVAKSSGGKTKTGYPFTIGFLQVSTYIQRHLCAESEQSRDEWISAINYVQKNVETKQHQQQQRTTATSTFSPTSNNDHRLVHSPTAPQMTMSKNSVVSIEDGSASADEGVSTQHKCQTYPCYDDFDKLKVLGQGSFGKVMLVREKKNGRKMAMKILKKSTLVAKNEVNHTLTEKHVLKAVSHPFLTQLIYAFQDQYRLFFVMEYAHGGELFYHLGQERRFEESKARFYAAEIVLGIGHLHKQNILYRDIKLENIMIDHEGHIKITDFGLCKSGIDDASTFCGTPEYLAPEVIGLRMGSSVNSSSDGGDADEDLVYGRAVDWWALGIVLYEMLFGRLPFFGSSQLDSKESQKELYRKICHAPLRFPQPRPSAQQQKVLPPVSAAAKSILEGFLEKDPNLRLGARPPPDGLNDIKQHRFFTPSIDWDALEQKQIPPPFVPEGDKEYFEKMFTDKPIELTPPEKDRYINHHNSDELFKGFSE